MRCRISCCVQGTSLTPLMSDGLHCIRGERLQAPQPQIMFSSPVYVSPENSDHLPKQVSLKAERLSKRSAGISLSADERPETKAQVCHTTPSKRALSTNERQNWKVRAFGHHICAIGCWGYSWAGLVPNKTDTVSN